MRNKIIWLLESDVGIAKANTKEIKQSQNEIKGISFIKSKKISFFEKMKGKAFCKFKGIQSLKTLIFVPLDISWVQKLLNMCLGLHLECESRLNMSVKPNIECDINLDSGHVRCILSSKVVLIWVLNYFLRELSLVVGRFW